jgi:hypothetical protein
LLPKRIISGTFSIEQFSAGRGVGQFESCLKQRLGTLWIDYHRGSTLFLNQQCDSVADFDAKNLNDSTFPGLMQIMITEDYTTR